LRLKDHDISVSFPSMRFLVPCRGQPLRRRARQLLYPAESIQEANVLGENADTIDLEIVFA